NEICGQQPQFVEVDAQPGMVALECHPNVEKWVQEHGGEVQYGWLIWEHHRLFLELIFHSVWKKPDSTLLDITATQDGESRILFLPDNRYKFDGYHPAPIRRLLTDIPVMSEYVELLDRQNAIVAKYPAGIQLSEPDQRTYDNLAANLAQLGSMYASG